MTHSSELSLQRHSDSIYFPTPLEYWVGAAPSRKGEIKGEISSSPRIFLQQRHRNELWK